jgi:hypothetical protein
MDALFCVLRCFADDNVARAGRKKCPAALDAVGELDVLTTELALADAATVERRLEKAGREAKGKKAPPEELATLERFRAALDAGTPVRALDLDGAARRLAGELFLLTAKPTVYVLSRGKPGVAAEEEPAAAFAARAARDGTTAVSCFAQLEGELAQLGGDDERCLREEYGLPPASSREDLLTAGAALLKLITFYTVEGTITSAWRVPAGTTAQEGAAKVHSDLGAHFIRAEVVGAAALIAAGGMREARAAGAARVEGPAYVLADGDVLTVKHGA